MSKLVPRISSREFRRDQADIHQMHRTLMSAFPRLSERAARQAHGVLWRLDHGQRGIALYVQSRTEPDWDLLPAGYVARPAEVRSLKPYLDSIEAGRKYAFRLVAQPTRAVPAEGEPGARGRGRRVAHRSPEKQVEWLARRGERDGFVVPLASDGAPDILPVACPRASGRSGREGVGTIVVRPVRFEGHLVVTDVEALREAVVAGIGPGKAYGCGLLTLVPPRRVLPE
ncbi:type I-E CRISPR-associated protein Cas6/Cse3/CasE [Actinoalloteichus caeruleus]|uniref:type I-E CRISPR-associated protein Cas6/Cse3/CasE n=1 Tax=Actinoalloteichus cyanogriseus TaxID=2893586 RepID=UPI003AAB1B37